jgi:VIT1/CCC1 family predicted Fe2+/Mn2+ transporter
MTVEDYVSNQVRTHAARDGGHDEEHSGTSANWLNRLRAAVLGADDGIVSTAGLVVGVAGATSSRATILTAGLAGVVAGAMSMGAGEYVSVSSQRDTEQAALRQERRELADNPDGERDELAQMYVDRGLSPATAAQVALELHANDPLRAHAEIELGISPDDVANPWGAAITSLIAFALGSILPLLAIVLTPTPWRVPVTFAAVLFALALTGSLSARFGGGSSGRAVTRLLVGGALAMIVTYGIGRLVGHVV